MVLSCAIQKLGPAVQSSPESHRRFTTEPAVSDLQLLRHGTHRLSRTTGAWRAGAVENEIRRPGQ
jgi:hypothetical protein